MIDAFVPALSTLLLYLGVRLLVALDRWLLRRDEQRRAVRYVERILSRGEPSS